MMNRGTQLFLIGLDGQPIGPFGWPLIREWASLSLLNPSAVVFVEGGADWEPLANHPELLTTDEAGKGCVRQWLESHPRRGQPATDEEMRHLETLGCPVDLSSGDSAMSR
jgi:hypothetical protein